MDMTTLMKLMTSANSTSAVSQNTGATQDQVTQVLSSVLPQLLNGASTQATGKDTAQAFAKALESHGAADTSDLAKFLGNVDMADGAKIVQHLLGGNNATATKAAAQAAGVSEKDASNIISNVAPLLMSVLGQQNKKNSTSAVIKSLMDGVDAKDVINIVGLFLKK